MGREDELFGEPIDMSEDADDSALFGLHDTSAHRTPQAAERAPAPPPRGGAQTGRQVRIFRLRTRDREHGRIGEVGRGRLLDKVTVGRPARLAVESGPALITSPVRQVIRVSPRELQLTTTNSVYKIEFLD